MTASDPIPEEAFVPAFRSSGRDGEMEAMTILGVLKTNEVPAILIGSQVLPSLEFHVQVPEHMVERAQQIIEEARAGGPAAAAEAEAAGES